MKTLLVLRHAKSSWDDADLNDHDRPLNKRGKLDAPRVGKLLRAEGLIPDLVISSTAKRAKKTAEAVIEESGYAGELILQRDLYAAPPESYLEVLSRLQSNPQTILVVGHNPGLEELVTGLTNEEVTLKTATLAQVELPIDSWSEVGPATEGRLVQVWYTREIK